MLNTTVRCFLLFLALAGAACGPDLEEPSAPPTEVHRAALPSQPTDPCGCSNLEGLPYRHCMAKCDINRY